MSCHRVSVFGLYRVGFSLTASLAICRRAVTSRIHRLRPWVAATISPAVGWIATSWTATVGRPLSPLILVQAPPRSSETYRANSVPQYSRFGLVRSSRRHRLDPLGRLFRIGFQV